MSLKVVRCFCVLFLVACGDDSAPVADTGTGDSSADSGAPDGGTPDRGIPDGDTDPDMAVPDSCGNGRLDPGEACDGADLGGQSCEGLGLEGTLTCTATCTLDDTMCTSPGCPMGRRDCDGVCVDLSASNSNCGACGTTCGEGAFCSEGACTCVSPDEVACGTECVPQSDENCGVCGTRCGADSVCASPSEEYACQAVDLRISDDGLLEAGIAGDWRGVCRSRFDAAVGEVVCRQFGLAYSAHRAANGPSRDFWLNGGDCAGDESNLLQCENVQVGGISCEQSDWVSLICREPRDPSDATVRIEDGLVEFLHEGQWRGVCDDGFDEQAGAVACRELGGTYGSHRTSQRGSSSSFWVDDLSCVGTELALEDCAANMRGDENCDRNEWVELTCDGIDPGPDPDPEPEPTGDVRIRDGLLEYFNAGEWRGVCDDSFGENDAQVACRELGLAYVEHTTGQNGPSESFWLDELGCTGREASLADCTANALGMTNCGNDEWVGLVCEEPGAGTGNVRIRDGLLEYRNEGEWRGVCDDSFDENDGAVACRELGRVYVSHQSARFGPSADFWLDDLACDGTEPTLLECPGNPLGSEDCGSSEWVNLVCRVPDPDTDPDPDPDPDPVGNVRIQGGLLEYFNAGEWRGVCDDSFDANDGRVACRELGQSYVSHTGAQRGPNGDFWLDDLACGGSEATLADCSSSPIGVENCGATEWVALECSGGTSSNVRLQGGLLEYFNAGEWRGVCDDQFDANDGRVACRELGGTYVSHVSSQTGPNGAFWLDGLRCSGDEATLADCISNPLGDEDCSASEWVRLNCSGI